MAGVGAGETAGNEVATKILGILLSAMAEKNGIYWVASANKISHIQISHPEFLRKGRFDNIWYVPLPDEKTRASIFGIHCRLNDIDINQLAISDIVKKMENWSGAEVEHICKEAAVKCIASGNKLKITTELIEDEIDKVKGVSASIAINKELHDWAQVMALNVNE